MLSQRRGHHLQQDAQLGVVADLFSSHSMVLLSQALKAQHLLGHRLLVVEGWMAQKRLQKRYAPCPCSWCHLSIERSPGLQSIPFLNRPKDLQGASAKKTNQDAMKSFSSCMLLQSHVDEVNYSGPLFNVVLLGNEQPWPETQTPALPLRQLFLPVLWAKHLGLLYHLSSITKPISFLLLAHLVLQHLGKVQHCCSLVIGWLQEAPHLLLIRGYTSRYVPLPEFCRGFSTWGNKPTVGCTSTWHVWNGQLQGLYAAEQNSFTHTHRHVHIHIIHIHPGGIIAFRFVVSKSYSRLSQTSIFSWKMRSPTEGLKLLCRHPFHHCFLFSDAEVLCGHFIKSVWNIWQWLSTNHVGFPTSIERSAHNERSSYSLWFLWCWPSCWE